MSDNTVILEVKELHKSFDGHEVLKGISTTIKKGDVLVVLSNTSLTLEILNSEAELAEKQNILRNTLISMEQEKLSLRQDKAQLDLDVSRKKRAWQQNEELYRNALIAREEWLQSKEDYELAEKKRELNIERQVQDSLYRSVQIEQMEENLDNMKRNMQLIRERIGNPAFDHMLFVRVRNCYSYRPHINSCRKIFFSFF